MIIGVNKYVHTKLAKSKTLLQNDKILHKQ